MGSLGGRRPSAVDKAAGAGFGPDESATPERRPDPQPVPGGAPGPGGGAGGREPGDKPKRPRLVVEDETGRRPFMRGIMIHSLMARGVAFEEAYRTAHAVRDRLGGRAVVPKAEILGILRELLDDDVWADYARADAPDDITVSGPGHELPFSKGVLSQSLLAAAIEPHDAFDVAREIEVELRRQGVRRVERHDLRRLAYETLGRQLGPQTAERYLVWRRYQEPERPVILLLGGATGVGKTALALEAAHRLGIGRVLSTDSIRQIMRIMLSEKFAPALHGSSYDAHRLLPTDALGSDPVIEGFRAQASTVSVGVRASMDRAVAENASLVMDGVSIVPGLIDPADWDEVADVIFLVVATLDASSFANRFAARATVQRAPHRYVENLEAILRIQEHILELAERHRVPIVDNVSFDRSVLLIIRHVTETLRKRGDFDVAKLF